MKKHLPTFLLCSCLPLQAAIAADSTKETQLQSVKQAVTQLEKNLSQAEFSKKIKQKYQSSYRFFSKLSAKQQKEVYKFYQKDNNFEAIRHKIFTLFFATSKVKP